MSFPAGLPPPLLPQELPLLTALFHPSTSAPSSGGQSVLVAHIMVTQPETHQEPAKLPERVALHFLLPTPWMLLLAGLIAGDLMQGWGEPCSLGEELGSLGECRELQLTQRCA